ncbi:MAG: helix-turn-helix domain-containing protein [Phenylobacterium sp.]
MSERIGDAAARARAHQALGRSEVLHRLFDFLLETSGAGQRPKELEIAAAVFGRDSAFDGAQDASVRVAVHRLRRKLDDFYSGPGRREPVRLSIPLGEYRIVAENRPPPDGIVDRWNRMGWRTAFALFLAINALGWALVWGVYSTGGELGRVRRQAPWTQLAKVGRPVVVVVGDYYIFGETDEAAHLDRLVREYSINSREDLDAYLMDNPEAMGRYRDLDLYYLPAGAGAALRDVLPVLARPGMAHDQIRVVVASDLTPEMLKRDDIVYVGYLSGLRLLREAVFSGSRFSVGDTYDELIDGKTGRHYLSQEGGPAEGESSRRDYGYFASFRGPQGNRIVVIAGTRDVALMQTADAVTTSGGLRALLRQAGRADAFEALYEAHGVGRSNLDGRLVVTAARPADAPPRKLQFPVG